MPTTRSWTSGWLSREKCLSLCPWSISPERTLQIARVGNAREATLEGLVSPLEASWHKNSASCPSPSLSVTRGHGAGVCGEKGSSADCNVQGRPGCLHETSILTGIMEKKMETTIMENQVEKKMETTIMENQMENQMEKKMENEMETGIIMGYITSYASDEGLQASSHPSDRWDRPRV